MCVTKILTSDDESQWTLPFVGIFRCYYTPDLGKGFDGKPQVFLAFNAIEGDDTWVVHNTASRDGT
jgi:hypothetical protein